MEDKKPRAKRKPLSDEARKRISDAQVIRWKGLKLKMIADRKERDEAPAAPVVDPHQYLESAKETSHTIVRVVPPVKE